MCDVFLMCGNLNYIYAAASELWNDLPLHVKNSQTLVQFKSSLKTHLFTLAF